MGRKGLVGCALHLFSIASSLVLKPPQSLPETIANTSIPLDASFKSSAIQISPIPTRNTQSNLTSSLSLANITAPADDATLNRLVIACDVAPFTRSGPASYASCQDAFEYTRGGADEMTFGDRASGDWDVALPVRVMSNDGLCVIDLDVAEPGQVDHSSLTALKLAAWATLSFCVQGLNRGGVATSLGQNGRLTISFKQYLPTVQCTPSDKPPVGEMCNDILVGMPASKVQQVFGEIDMAGIDIPLPWTKATPGLQCVIEVRMTAGLTGRRSLRTSWCSIWEQAVALTVLCAHAGKNGHAYIYDGGQPRMTISIVNEARQSLAIGAPDDTS